jgi:hypothetical protein
MSTFSLLQLSLDQTIDRPTFEDASAKVPSLARADGAMLHRRLYGIVVSNLPEEEALAFQAELAQHSFATEVVPDRELPLLQESFRVQSIDCREGELVLADSMGHQRIRPVTDLVFVAAGFVSRLHFVSEWDQHIESDLDSHGSARLVVDREHHEQREVEFRVDFFFKSAPERQHAAIRLETLMHHQGHPLRLRDTDGLNELLSTLARLLPAERVNSFLQNPESHLAYPTFRCYEEEIRWFLHRLGVKDGRTPPSPCAS